MRALVPGLVAIVLLCGCTGGSSDGAPATSVHPLLAQVGEVLGAEPTDPEVEHPIPPECPAAYHRVLASATYAGARVAVDGASPPRPPRGRDVRRRAGGGGRGLRPVPRSRRRLLRVPRRPGPAGPRDRAARLLPPEARGRERPGGGSAARVPGGHVPGRRDLAAPAHLHR